MYRLCRSCKEPRKDGSDAIVCPECQDKVFVKNEEKTNSISYGPGRLGPGRNNEAPKHTYVNSYSREYKRIVNTSPERKITTIKTKELSDLIEEVVDLRKALTELKEYSEQEAAKAEGWRMETLHKFMSSVAEHCGATLDGDTK